MPRVLLTGFCAVPGPRRAGVQLRHVIRSLTAFHGVDLLVVREGEQGYVERQGSVRVLRVPTHDADQRAQIQAYQRAVKRQLDGADYDVVHCRDAWACIPVLDARSRFGYAVVYDLTRSPLGESLLDPELDAQYGRDEEACILAADLVLAPTPAAVTALRERGKPERVVLSPPGVDVDRFDWDEPQKSGPPRIVYAGSIDPGRGVRVLVRAMAAIVREVDARLVLAGPMISAKFEAALRDGIRELGLTDKVEILGAVDHEELPALLATATVCVVPAAADLTPNPAVVYPTKLLEYMACKRAIVAPRRDTISMVVENGREALLFEPGDPMDLARKVLRLLGEPELRDRLADAAYERVRRDFTASAARRHLRAAYQTLVDRFGDQFSPTSDDEAPKVELLADDDFEATVCEEAPRAPGVDTSLNRIAGPESIDAHLTTGSTSDVIIVTADGDDTGDTGDTGEAPSPPNTEDSGVLAVPPPSDATKIGPAPTGTAIGPAPARRPTPPGGAPSTHRPTPAGSVGVRFTAPDRPAASSSTHIGAAPTSRPATPSRGSATSASPPAARPPATTQPTLLGTAPAARPSSASDASTAVRSAASTPQADADAWASSALAAAVASLEEESAAETDGGRAGTEDGTPVLGMPVSPPPPASLTENVFVAGEIDVPDGDGHN